MQRVITILFLLIFLGSACAPVAQVEAVPLIGSATPRPVFISTITVIPTLPTSTPLPLRTPTIHPTLEPIRSTPPTLMLHRPNLRFDSLAFLKDFVKILKQNEMEVVTYRQIYEEPEITAIEKGHLFIITIDDIYLAYPMDKHVIEMIEVLREAGYPAVLGVVTETDYPYPETVERLKELSSLGWEIASHTDHHKNLGELEKASDQLIYEEVLPSLDKLETAIGIRPITLVLPEGQMLNNAETLYNMGFYWVVGINGGTSYDSRARLIYVGREGPAKNAEYTYKIMKMRFGF